MSIVASSETISESNVCVHQVKDRSYRSLPYDQAFNGYWQARRAGCQSKTAWGKIGRNVKADELPSIVVLESGTVRGLSGHEIVLEDEGDDLYLVASEYYEVYRSEQTEPKPTRTRNRAGSVSKDKPAAFYIPVNLDSTVFPETHRPYVHYFLNLVHWKWLNWQADEKGFIYLKADYLTRVIPNDPPPG